MARKMKDSGVEWIGEIPEDWEVTRIAGLYSLRNTKVSDRDFPPLSVTKNGILPQLKTAAKSDDHNNRKLVKKGDFVINSRSDRKGSCGISKYDGSVSLINTVLAPREEMNPEYFNWVFRSSSFAEEFYKWGNGIVDDLWTTNWMKMRNINVPFPDKNQQKSIVKILNRIITDLDSVKENIKKEIQTLEEYKKSVITEAVTKGVDKNVEMKDSGIEWIGEIPKHWEIIALKHMSRSYSGGTPSRNKLDYWKNGTIPWVSSGEVNKGYIYETEEKITEKGLLNSSAKIFPANTVLVALNGQGKTKGKAAILKISATTNQSLTGFVCDETTLHHRFLYYLFIASYKFNRSYYAGGENRDGIAASNLKTARIPTPKIFDQIEISDYLDKKTQTIDESIDIKRKQLEVLDEYKKSLIYEYVTGKREV